MGGRAQAGWGTGNPSHPDRALRVCELKQRFDKYRVCGQVLSPPRFAGEVTEAQRGYVTFQAPTATMGLSKSWN